MGKDLKMRKIRVYVSTNKVGSECYDEFEVEDDCAEEEINELAEEYILDMINTYWKEIE